MTASLDFLLRKADAFDAEFAADLHTGSMRSLYAGIDVSKLAGKLPAFDEPDMLDFFDRCRRPGQRVLALSWVQNRRQQKGPLPATEPFLLDCLQQPVWRVWCLASSELAHMGTESAKRALEAAYKQAQGTEARYWLESALAHFAYPVVPAHVRRAFADYPSGRSTAIEALGNITSYDATDMLLEAFVDKDKHFAGQAMRVLEKREDPRIAPALVSLIGEGRAATKLMAVKLLGYRREDYATETLLDVMRNGKSREIRKAAALALGKIGNRAAVPHLLERLADPDEHLTIKGAAVIALGKIGDPEALGALKDVVTQRAYGKGNVDMMVAGSIYVLAVDAIGRMDTPAAATTLMEFLNLELEAERAESAQSLARREHLPALPALEDLLENSFKAPSDYRSVLEKAIKRLRRAEQRLAG